MMCGSRVMRIPACIWLCPEDRTRLEWLVADRNTSRKVVWRSRIVLLSAEGHGTMEIMRRTAIPKPTVWRWQARYLEAGVDGLLHDKSRPPGTPPLAPAVKALVLTKTMREMPSDATHWRVRSMARAVGISHNFFSTHSGQEPDTALWNGRSYSAVIMQQGEVPELITDETEMRFDIIATDRFQGLYDRIKEVDDALKECGIAGRI